MRSFARFSVAGLAFYLKVFLYVLLPSERTGIWSRRYRGAEDELSAVCGGWAFKRELRYVILAKFGAIFCCRPCFLSQGLSLCLRPLRKNRKMESALSWCRGRAECCPWWLGLREGAQVCDSFVVRRGCLSSTLLSISRSFSILPPPQKELEDGVDVVAVLERN